jgi:hypothetical protein
VARNYALLAQAAGASLTKGTHSDQWFVSGLPSEISIRYVGDDSVSLEVRLTPPAAADLISQLIGASK